MGEKGKFEEESLSDEEDRLDSIATNSVYALGILTESVRFGYGVFSRFINPWDKVLELGPAEGLGTEILHQMVSDLTVVDGSKHFCQELESKFPDVKVVNNLFEEFTPGVQFDVIICAHVLEHVEHPGMLLRSIRRWLRPGGKLIAAVPNANSIHRQTAVRMGLLQVNSELNATDLRQGHRRVYNPEGFRKEICGEEIDLEVFAGYWLKPLSNAQIDADWSPAMNEAFFALGEEYPEIAAEIYIVAT